MFISYFIIFFIISVFIKSVSPYQHTPILKNINAPRLFGIIPYRELFGIPPISLMVLYAIKKYNKENIVWYTLIYQSIGYMFITGIIIHAIFNVRSMLSHTLFSKLKPNGTGIAPYSNYTL